MFKETLILGVFGSLVIGSSGFLFGGGNFGSNFGSGAGAGVASSTGVNAANRDKFGLNAANQVAKNSLIDAKQADAASIKQKEDIAAADFLNNAVFLDVASADQLSKDDVFQVSINAANSLDVARSDKVQFGEKLNKGSKAQLSNALAADQLNQASLAAKDEAIAADKIGVDQAQENVFSLFDQQQADFGKQFQGNDFIGGGFGGGGFGGGGFGNGFGGGFGGGFGNGGFKNSGFGNGGFGKKRR